MPVANCRTSPLQNKDENRYFDHLLKFGNRQYKWFLNSFFDLCSDDVELELCRLTAWIDKVATAPLQLPYSFKSNQTSAFRVRISVPDGDGQKDIDWSTCPALPILVFNYGERLVYNENRARSTWDWPEHRQVVFPVSPTGIPGELEGEISLPCEGFGHALLTLGEPATRHKAKTEDLFLWWDFFVDIY